LVPEIARHYIRINPAGPDPECDEDPNCGSVVLANQPPGAPFEYQARDIVDPGFLELVRYGIRQPDDPDIVNSLRVIDAVLKVDLPSGPCWRRYNHDGYGQRQDGSAYVRWGQGRPWPLLTGERGHYEVAAGRDAGEYLATIEACAQGMGLIPEQVWDGPDIPDQLLYFGGPTGSAIPLLWAHAEYIKLRRSVADRRVFDLIDPVHRRYAAPDAAERAPIEVWTFRRRARTAYAGGILRVQVGARFVLHWSTDDWKTASDSPSQSTALGIEYVDIAITADAPGLVQFTFFWPDADHWEGTDFSVAVMARTEEQERKAIYA
jgi:glucoamylase